VRSKLDSADAHVNMGVNEDGAEGSASGGLLNSRVEIDWAAVNRESGCSA